MASAEKARHSCRNAERLHVLVHSLHRRFIADTTGPRQFEQFSKLLLRHLFDHICLLGPRILQRVPQSLYALLDWADRRLERFTLRLDSCDAFGRVGDGRKVRRSGEVRECDGRAAAGADACATGGFRGELAAGPLAGRLTLA
jgi:hypothetical protein